MESAIHSFLVAGGHLLLHKNPTAGVTPVHDSKGHRKDIAGANPGKLWYLAALEDLFYRAFWRDGFCKPC
jgi:hypothetical protein